MKRKNKSFKVLSPTGILGYGFPMDSFERGMKKSPDLIAVDAGSTDPGPYYLGKGVSFTDRSAVKRDLEVLLTAGLKHRVPVIVGTAGGAGARPHILWCRTIIEELAMENNLSFRLDLIYADVEKSKVLSALKNGKVKALKFAPELTDKVIRESVNIVAQMGMEPIMEALRQRVKDNSEVTPAVILCGRAYDPAVFAALPVIRGFDPGLALHMGKILECAAIAAEPGSGADCVVGTLYENSFILESLNPARRFTVKSTAAHTLYEKSDPYFLHGPGGRLNLTRCHFNQVSPGEVEVRGSRWEPSEPYYVKLEAVRSAGFRTICIAGIRDPVMIQNIETIIQELKSIIQDRMRIQEIESRLFFHLYGINGVMGAREPAQFIPPHEVGLLIEAIGSTQAEADTLCSLTRSTLLHYGYAGRISTAGNLAFPFSPSDVKTGEVFEFSIYHLMEIDNQDMFKIETVDVK